MYELRASLEGLAARRAATQVARGTTEHAGALAQDVILWESMFKVPPMAAFSEQNRRFHALIVTVSGNAHLPRMSDQTLLALFAGLFRGWLAPGSMKAAIADHLAVLQAVAEGAEARAEKSMRRYIRDSAAAILALPSDAFN